MSIVVTCTEYPLKLNVLIYNLKLITPLYIAYKTLTNKVITFTIN